MYLYNLGHKSTDRHLGPCSALGVRRPQELMHETRTPNFHAKIIPILRFVDSKLPGDFLWTRKCNPL